MIHRSFSQKNYNGVLPELIDEQCKENEWKLYVHVPFHNETELLLLQLICYVIVRLQIISHWCRNVIMQWLCKCRVKFGWIDIGTVRLRIWLALYKYLAGASCARNAELDNSSKTILHQRLSGGIEFIFGNFSGWSFSMFKGAIWHHWTLGD